VSLPRAAAAAAAAARARSALPGVRSLLLRPRCCCAARAPSPAPCGRPGRRWWSRRRWPAW